VLQLRQPSKAFARENRTIDAEQLSIAPMKW